MRVLITGATGFVGGHLARALAARPGFSLLGVSRHGEWPDRSRDLGPLCPLAEVDWSAPRGVLKVLHDFQPQWLIHLAGYANAGASFRQPEQAWDGNLALTRTLYEAVERWAGRCRILYVSSGLIYGEPDRPGEPMDERTPLRPASPYAASKAAADLLSYQVTRHPGLDVVRARPFNHIGPGQSADYAAANFARQLAEIEAGLRPPVMETGDLSGQRDLTDVRDVAASYVRLLEAGRGGEAYNVGSGTTHSMESILRHLTAQLAVQVEVRQRPDPHRKGDTAVTRAGIDRIRREVGWEPTTPLNQTLADMLADWRQRVGPR